MMAEYAWMETAGSVPTFQVWRRFRPLIDDVVVPLNGHRVVIDNDVVFVAATTGMYVAGRIGPYATLREAQQAAEMLDAVEGV